MKNSSNPVTISVDLFAIEDDDVFQARLKYAPTAWTALSGDQQHALGLLLRDVFLQLAETSPAEWIPKGLVHGQGTSYALVVHIQTSAINQAVMDLRVRAEREQADLINQLTLLGQELTDG